MCEHHKALGVSKTAEIPADQLPEKQLAAATSDIRSMYAQVLLAEVSQLTNNVRHFKPILSETELKTVRTKLEEAIAVIDEKEEPTQVIETSAKQVTPTEEQKAAEIEDPKKEATLKAYEQNDHNVKATAEALGVSVPTIYGRLKKYGVKTKGRRKKKAKK